MTIKYQNYKHYKLPITINPLDYGKLIYTADNIYIIQITKHTIGLITQSKYFNEVKFFKDGDLIFIYKDHIIDDNTFIRSIENRKFTFTENKLKSIITDKTIIRPNILNNSINKLGITLFNYKSNRINNQSVRLFHTSQISTNFNLTTFSKDNITFLSDQIINKKLLRIGNYHYFKFSKLEINLIKDFLQQLESNKAYIVLPILAVEGLESTAPILSLTNQILVTRDSDSNTILNFIFNQIELTCVNYGIDNLNNSIIVFKFRPITLKDEIIEKIPLIRYDIKEKTYKKNITLMNSKYYNGSIIPLTMNLSMYGEQLTKMLSLLYILRFNLNPDGMFYKKDEFIIYINMQENGKHEGILFKDKTIFYKFEDILIEDNKFIRITDKFIIHIDNFIISYFEKLINNSFITKSNSNVKLNTNIVTFDIETYIKDGQFIPFACG